MGARAQLYNGGEQAKAGEAGAHLSLRQLREIVPDLVERRFFKVEIFLYLVKVSRLNICAEADKTGIRRILTEQGLKQRSFAAAVGTEQEHSFALSYVQIHVFKNPFFSKGL